MYNFYISFRMAVILFCFAFLFKPILKRLFFDSQFLALISILLQMLHTLYIPLSSWCPTLRLLLCLLIVLNYLILFFIFLSLEKPDFRAFLVPKDLLRKAQRILGILVVLLPSRTPEGEVSNSVVG